MASMVSALAFVPVVEATTEPWFAFVWPISWAFIWLLVDNVIRVVAVFVVPRNRRPTSGMAWLMAIFLAPVPGLLLFLLIGGNRLPKKRRLMQQQTIDFVRDLSERKENTAVTDIAALPSGVRNAVMLGSSLGAQPMLSGNSAEMSIDYEESIRQMAEAIRQSQKYVHMEFYILVHDDTTDIIFEAMRDAVARGVKVRVLIDHISALRNPGFKKTAQSLESLGADFTYMLPVRPWKGEWQRPDLRNHRKILVIDGTVGFMGSQNLVDSSYNKPANRRRGLHWKDLMVRLEGPVVVGLEAVFVGDWYLETGDALAEAFYGDVTAEAKGNLDCQILPSGPGYSNENNLQVFTSLLYTATKRISVTSPYFIPDGSLMHALRAATARGVDVELFVSEIGDQPVVYHAQRSYYEELLRAGVKIFMFRPPYILHSKHFTIDSTVAVVGSSNMDQRSFNLNMEVSMIVHGAEFINKLDEVTDYYRQNSRELTLEEWERQSLPSQLLDGLARLTSALQ